MPLFSACALANARTSAWAHASGFNAIRTSNKNSEVKMVPLVHTIPEACSGAKIGRTALYEAIRSGALRAVKRGKRTLIFDDDLRRWLRSLPEIKITPQVKQAGSDE
jgi:excisionase family DNA binding protein